MEHLRFASACSTEDLIKVFDPEYEKGLNCPLAEHVLRLLVIELIGREVKMTESMREAFIGPETCKHGRSLSSICGQCDIREEEED